MQSVLRKNTYNTYYLYNIFFAALLQNSNKFKATQRLQKIIYNLKLLSKDQSPIHLISKALMILRPLVSFNAKKTWSA